MFKDLLKKIPLNVQVELHSAFTTFTSAVLIDFGYQISQNHTLLDPTTLSWGILYGLGGSAIRSGVKAVWQWGLAQFGVKVPVKTVDTTPAPSDF